ncbi:MAG TPA: bacillithiol biosynthesis deacetylase BshB1 [Bacteroidia bacterium]|nr:bacillithiol biosynthesis deacetylase BshB1 [Bacteroidia bacterium]
MKVDVLAIGAHPDDVELSCSGSLILLAREGKKIGMLDLTRGELGTRGTPEIRIKEAEDSAKVLGVSVRENLSMADGFFRNDKDHQLKVVQAIRNFQPEIIICNAISDRHPDHGKGSGLISTSVFLAGLAKVKTQKDGNDQLPWKTKVVYHYIQDRYIKPDFVIDVSEVWEQRMESVKAYKSQFYDPQSKEPETAISTKEFLDFLASRAAEFGRQIGVKYAEGFTVERTPGVRSLFDLI